MMDPEIGEGVLTVARTQVQVVPVVPQALPAKTQMLQPEEPPAGRDTKVRFTVGTVVS